MLQIFVICKPIFVTFGKRTFIFFRLFQQKHRFFVLDFGNAGAHSFSRLTETLGLLRGVDVIKASQYHSEHFRTMFCTMVAFLPYEITYR
jgi:hypothetical protein